MKCLNCQAPYKNMKKASCCGKYIWIRCCEDPVIDNQKNREIYGEPKQEGESEKESG